MRRVSGVADAAAVGITGPDGGEQVAVAVVLEKGADATPEQVRRASREFLAGYKVPRRVVVLEDLPRSMIGKVLRREVRELLEQQQS